MSTLVQTFRGMIVLSVLLACAPFVQARSPDDAADATHGATYQRACELYRQGVELRSSSTERAERLFVESASLFRSLIETEDGRQRTWDAGLIANAGHAALMSGDIGRAVLFYRRASVLLPMDADVRRGLVVAREKAGTKDVSQPSLERFASLSETVPKRVRGIVTLAAWATLWLGIGINRTRLRCKSPRWFLIGCGVVAVLGAATFVPLELLFRTSTDGVVIASVTPRQGPDDVNYPAARTEPFKPGMELRVLEQRGDWCCVSLTENDRAWVKAAAVARVFGE